MAKKIAYCPIFRTQICLSCGEGCPVDNPSPCCEACPLKPPLKRPNPTSLK